MKQQPKTKEIPFSKRIDNYAKNFAEMKVYLQGKEEGRIQNQKQIQSIIKWLKGSIWCNAHDTAWIEQTIEKLEKLI